MQRAATSAALVVLPDCAIVVRFSARLTHGYDGGTLGWQRGAVRLDAALCLAPILLVGDVVAVEHGARLVAADRHGDRLGNTSPHHVTDRRPAKVVEQARRDGAVAVAASALF